MVMERSETMQKSIDRLTENMFGKTEKGHCVFCKEKINGFRNELSLEEFYISGICQKCQDEIFGLD